MSNKDNALQQAKALGTQHGATDFNARGYVDVVDIVSECPAAGAWLDELTGDPAAFNQAHRELRNAYQKGYTQTPSPTTPPL